MQKRLLPLLLGFILLLSVAPPGPARADDPIPFPDLKGHWAEATVMQAVAAGFVNGYPDGTFQPDRPITRAEYVKMLVTAAHLPASTWQPSFFDTQNHWVQTQGYLSQALAVGMVTPQDYLPGFAPDQVIPRQEMAVLAERLLGRVAWAQALAGGDIDFTDQADVPGWARGYIRLAANDDHILSGYPDGTFHPAQGATRAEAVTVIQRTLAAMNLGVDPHLHLAVNGNDVIPVVPLAVRDGFVYAPVTSVYGPDSLWGFYSVGGNSSLTYNIYPRNAVFRAIWPQVEVVIGGNTWRLITKSPTPTDLHGNMSVPTYMVNGQLMVPVAPVGGSGHFAFLDAVHDAHAGTLHVTTTPDWPGNHLPTSPDAAHLTFPWPPPANVTHLSLVPLLVADAAGNELAPVQPLVPHYHVDPSSPLRLRSKESTELVTDVDGEGFVQLLDPSHIPEGTYTILCSAPGYQPLTWTLTLHDNPPVQVTIDPIAAVTPRQVLTLKIHLLDQLGKPAFFDPTVRPQVTVQRPDGSTDEALVSTSQTYGNSSLYWANGVATVQCYVWQPGIYHFTVTIPATPAFPQLQGTADATVNAP